MDSAFCFMVHPLPDSEDYVGYPNRSDDRCRDDRYGVSLRKPQLSWP